MVSYIDALANGARQALCKILDAPGAAVELSKKVLGSGPSSPPYNVPRALQKIICNNPPKDPYVPNFKGGQCDGVRYLVQATLHMFDSFNNRDTFIRSFVEVWGPVGTIDFENRATSGPPNYGMFVTCRGRTDSAIQPPGTKVTFGDAGSGNDINPRLEAISVTRNDGLPDTCGDPPPIVVPPFNPGDNITNVNINYTNNFGDNFNLTVPIAIGYFNVDINGNFNIPFNIQIDPTLNITGNINANNNTVNFNFGGGAGGDKNTPDPRPGPQPGDKQPVNPPPEQPPDTGDPKPPQPDDKEQQNVIVGALVTVLDIGTPAIGEVFQRPDNPQVFIPDLGLIHFRIDVSGASGWTSDIKIKNRQQYVPCPELAGAIDVKGTPREGVNWVITPVYDKKRLPVEFPPTPTPTPAPSPGPSPTPSPTP